MATQKELRELLAPVLQEYPDWQIARSWLFRKPIGYYLRGCVLNQSFYDRFGYRLLHCVYPLFEHASRAHISWGSDQFIPGRHTTHWDITDKDFAKNVVELMRTVIVPTTAHVVTGKDFLDYLTRRHIYSGWPEKGKALAYIHMGDLPKARELLVPLAQTIRTRFPDLQLPGHWGHNMLELLRLIDEDPAAIPAHCENVARRSIAATKLEKHWTPVPFVYGAGISRS